jgi:hypothetical protein
MVQGSRRTSKAGGNQLSIQKLADGNVIDPDYFRRVAAANNCVNDVAKQRRFFWTMKILQTSDHATTWPVTGRNARSCCFSRITAGASMAPTKFNVASVMSYCGIELVVPVF